MDKLYRPILPELSPSSRQTASSRRPPNRLRPLTRAACMSCQSKKTACDGKRPKCSRCINNNGDCSYITKDANETLGNALKRQINSLQKELKEHVDVLEHLCSVPEDEAIAIVRRLRSTSNVSMVLSSIKDSANITNQPSDSITSRGILPPTQSDVEFELNTIHNALSQPLTPLNINAAELDITITSHSSLSLAAYTFPPELLPGIAHAPIKDTDIVPAVLVEPPIDLRDAGAGRSPPITGPLRNRQYRDDRLRQLKISYWTNVPISDEFAARVISLHLETYDSLLWFFDSDLFLNDLVDHKLNYCSPFLVSALLSLACQSYSSFDTQASALSTAFMQDAENLWKSERSRDSVTTLAAMHYMSASTLWAAKDNLQNDLAREIRAMAARMKLYDIQPTK